MVKSDRTHPVVLLHVSQFHPQSTIIADFLFQKPSTCEAQATLVAGLAHAFSENVDATPSATSSASTYVQTPQEEASDPRFLDTCS